MKLRSTLYAALGLIFMVVGAVGTFLPILPGVPLLLIAAFFFAKSSERLNTWFKSTKLYKNNLESYMQERGMTVRVKARIITIVTIAITVSIFVFLVGNFIAQLFLFAVWLVFMGFFLFYIKTLPEKE